MDRLSDDEYLQYAKSFYDAGLALWGEDWEYHDINTVLLTAAKVLKPMRYLEIGVRRGRSAAMVLSQQPYCDFVGFDLWIPGYAGMRNPGPDFVHEELKRLGHVGNREFITGDSKVTVPAYFKTNPDHYFDIITVDGDHSAEGARADLIACMPRVKVGGVLVFDDTSNDAHPELNDVWDECIGDAPNFSSSVFNEVSFGIALAVRKY